MNREELEKAQQQLLQQYNEYVLKNNIATEHEEKVTQAKSEWEASWAKLMETLLMLEKLEI